MLVYYSGCVCTCKWLSLFPSYISVVMGFFVNKMWPYASVSVGGVNV